jgi:hypothetical protein
MKTTSGVVLLHERYEYTRIKIIACNIIVIEYVIESILRMFNV